MTESKIKKIEKLGEGSYGKVYRLSETEVVKEMQFYDIKSNEKEEIIDYYNLLNIVDAHNSVLVSQIDHPSLVKITRSPRFQDGKLMLYMENVKGIMLSEWAYMDIKIKHEDIYSIVFQIAAGLRALKCLNLIHCDLYGNNIMVSYKNSLPVVKIIDMGSAIEPNNKSTIHRIDKRFEDPEVHDRIEKKQIAGYSFKSDVYSFGTTIRHVLANKSINSESKIETNEKMDHLLDLLSKMCEPTEEKRVNIEDVYFNELFDKFRETDMFVYKIEKFKKEDNKSLLQPYITDKNVKELENWMKQTCIEENARESFDISISLLSRYLKKEVVRIKDLQETGSACMVIAGCINCDIQFRTFSGVRNGISKRVRMICQVLDFILW